MSLSAQKQRIVLSSIPVIVATCCQNLDIKINQDDWWILMLIVRWRPLLQYCFVRKYFFYPCGEGEFHCWTRNLYVLSLTDRKYVWKMILACRMRVQDPLELWDAALCELDCVCERLQMCWAVLPSNMNKNMNNYYKSNQINAHLWPGMTRQLLQWTYTVSPAQCCWFAGRMFTAGSQSHMYHMSFADTTHAIGTFLFLHRKLVPLTLTLCGCPCSLQSHWVKSITQPLICATYSSRGGMRGCRKVLDNLWQLRY